MGTFILQPRSYVIVGSLVQLTGDSGGPIPDKVRSFELFRRNLHEPEVITFDELVARAEWHIEAAAHGSASDELPSQKPGDPCAAAEDPWGRRRAALLTTSHASAEPATRGSRQPIVPLGRG